MDQAKQRKPLTCWIGIHQPVTRTDAGTRWQECGRCGKYSHKVDAANRFPPAGMGDGAGGGA